MLLSWNVFERKNLLMQIVLANRRMVALLIVVALVAVELRSLSGDKVEVDAMVRAVLAILGCGGLPEEPPDPSYL